MNKVVLWAWVQRNLCLFGLFCIWKYFVHRVVKFLIDGFWLRCCCHRFVMQAGLVCFWGILLVEESLVLNIDLCQPWYFLFFNRRQLLRLLFGIGRASGAKPASHSHASLHSLQPTDCFLIPASTKITGRLWPRNLTFLQCSVLGRVCSLEIINIHLSVWIHVEWLVRMCNLWY